MKFNEKIELSILSSIYLITRLPFARTIPLYYDSFEYEKIAQIINLNNLTSTLLSSHQPIHSGYLLLVLFFKKTLFFLNPGQVLSLISVVFGLLIIFVWYKLVREYKANNLAFWSCLFLLIFPYYFVVTSNILYESPLLFFQLFAFYLLLIYLKNRKYLVLVLASISLGLAISIFIGTLFIFPVYLSIYYLYKNKIKISILIIFYLISILTAVLIDVIFLKSSELIAAKYLSHISDWISARGGILIFIFRILRNYFIQGASILSIPGLLFFGYAVFKYRVKGDIPVHRSVPTLRNVPKLALFLLILPFLILAQYWHAGLFGRLSLYIIFPAAFFLPFYYRSIKMRLLIFFIIFLVSFKYMSAQKTVAPIYQYFNLYKNNAKEYSVAVVTSDYNRFLYQQNNVPVYVINGSVGNLEKTIEFIDQNLKSGNNVVIDSAAISFPYYQYDGEFYHPLSKQAQGSSIAQNILKIYQTSLWAEDSINKSVFFLKLTLPQLADRIKKLNSAYDRTNTNTSFWRSYSPDYHSGLHRLANFSDTLRNSKNADEIQHHG